MNYIIFDLEFNQKYRVKTTEDKVKKTNASSNLTFEIIQIGAIKISENFEKISTLNSFVKPTVHKTIHPYVQNMTGITEEQLEDNEDFPIIFDKLVKFIGKPNESILCVWGTVDIKELLRNIKFYNLPIDVIPKKYIDVQYHASKYFSTKDNDRIGLKNAIELLNLQISGDFHDAFNDAYYTCEVFKIIYTPKIKPLVYDHTNKGRVKGGSNKKYKVNMEAVFKQFEKMYNRKLSKSEKSMIELAYTMGRTQQFLIKDKDSN